MLDTLLIRLQKNIFPFFSILLVVNAFMVTWLLRNILIFFFDSSFLAVSSIDYSQIQQQISQTPQTELSREAIVAIPQGRLIQAKAINPKLTETTASVSSLRLIGILAGSPRFARALIRSESNNLAEAYALNEKIEGYTIIAMFPAFVELKDNVDVVHKLEIYDPGLQKLNVEQNSSANGNKVEKIVLSRDRFLQYLKDQAELFRVKFAPELEDGLIKGWRLLSVPEDHFLYSMGARSGDTIRRFNGQELQTQERLIQMWQSLKTLNKLTIDLIRNNATITYNVIIQ